MGIKIKFKTIKPFFVKLVLAIVFLGFSFLAYFSYRQSQVSLIQRQQLTDNLGKSIDELNKLKQRDEYKINEQLSQEIDNINKTFKESVFVYEELLKLKDTGKPDKKIDQLFAETLDHLSKRNYASASANLINLKTQIEKEKQKLIASIIIPETLPLKNEPPSAGYSRQKVSTDAGDFMVSLVAADLSDTKVIVDTASDSTCGNDCPVLSLGSYVARSGAFAGVNGSYFCPAAYPSCVGKTNSFDTLLMNKNKTYFNSDNNVYSTNPAVIFGSGYIRFVTSASQWGRDTGIDGMISNYPLLVFNSNISFGGDDDPKKGSKGARSFVAGKGSKVFIGVVHNATVAESARVLKAMGMENALNLDNGGSTALWSGGYKVGPGRDLPNVILFVRK